MDKVPEITININQTREVPTLKIVVRVTVCSVCGETVDKPHTNKSCPQWEDGGNMRFPSYPLETGDGEDPDSHGAAS